MQADFLSLRLTESFGLAAAVSGLKEEEEEEVLHQTSGHRESFLTQTHPVRQAVWSLGSKAGTQ